jgi:TonB family protein
MRPPAAASSISVQNKMGNVAEFSSQQDRRIYLRRNVRSLAYIDLGGDNGGIVLNMSEGGLALHSAVTLNEVHLPRVRFQLPHCPEWIETRAEIAWTSETKMQAGILFIGLSDRARQQIRDWVFTGGRSEGAKTTSRRPEAPRIPPPPDISAGRTASREPAARGATAPVRTFIGDAETPPARPSAPVVLVRTPSAAPVSIRPAPEVHRAPPRAKNAGNELSLRLGEITPQEPRAAWRSWSGFLALLAALAALSFFVGLTAGRGKFHNLLARFSGSAGNSDSASSQPPQSSAADIAQGISPAAPPTLSKARVIITSRMYVPVAAPTQSDASKVGRLQVGALEHRVEPQYSPDAARQHAEGTVQLHVTIGADGSIGNVALLSGPPALVQSATDAVRQWRYKPTLLDGKPIEIEADIAIVFWLPLPGQQPAQQVDQQPKQ